MQVLEKMRMDDIELQRAHVEANGAQIREL